MEKLYTTSTALLDFGPSATLTTSVLGVGQITAGTFTGTLYLRGGGDPTFGSAAFDQANYGTGATVQGLVRNLIAATGLVAIDGNVVADDSIFDSKRGTPATGYAPSTDVEGELSGLAFNRGWANNYGTALVTHPALTAGQQFVSALKAAGVQVPKSTRVRAGPDPVHRHFAGRRAARPRMATLIAMTNTPSDNYFAETLLKDVGARFGGAGTTAAGAAVVRSVIATHFGLRPRSTMAPACLAMTARARPRWCRCCANRPPTPPFVDSLSVAGRTGTLSTEMRGTYAQGRCRGKTGSLHDVSNVVGYCHARDGHTIAYAFLMNGVGPPYAHPIQDRMQVALAEYDG